MLFVNGARAFYTLILVVASTPLFSILIIPLAAIYLWIQRYYLRASRELKRLDSVSKSPIYAHFQESLGGMTTIRAYRHQQRFILENEYRCDSNLQAYFPSISANRWLAIRLECIGSVIILAAASFAIVAISSGGGPSAGMSHAIDIRKDPRSWLTSQSRVCRLVDELCPADHTEPELDCATDRRGRNVSRISSL